MAIEAGTGRRIPDPPKPPPTTTPHESLERLVDLLVKLSVIPAGHRAYVLGQAGARVPNLPGKP